MNPLTPRLDNKMIDTILDFSPDKLAVKIIKSGCCDSKVFVIHLPSGLMSYGYDVKNACDLIRRQAVDREKMQS